MHELLNKYSIQNYSLNINKLDQGTLEYLKKCQNNHLLGVRFIDLTPSKKKMLIYEICAYFIGTYLGFISMQTIMNENLILFNVWSILAIVFIGIGFIFRAFSSIKYKQLLKDGIITTTLYMLHSSGNKLYVYSLFNLQNIEIIDNYSNQIYTHSDVTIRFKSTQAHIKYISKTIADELAMNINLNKNNIDTNLRASNQQYFEEGYLQFRQIE